MSINDMVLIKKKPDWMSDDEYMKLINIPQKVTCSCSGRGLVKLGDMKKCTRTECLDKL